MNVHILARLTPLLLNEIRSERDGHLIEKSQVRSAIQMLIEVCKSSQNLYEPEFEQTFLVQTADYYRAESNSLIMEISAG